MTTDEALRIGEDECRKRAASYRNHANTGRLEPHLLDAAAALARLREEIPKLHAIVAENLTRPRLEIVARLDAILARLEEGEGT